MFLGGSRGDAECGGRFGRSVSSRDQSQHLSLASGKAERLERVEFDLRARAVHRVREGVALELDYVGAREVEQVTFARGEVSALTAEDDSEDPGRLRWERERDLILDPQLAIDALVDRKSKRVTLPIAKGLLDHGPIKMLVTITSGKKKITSATVTVRPAKKGKK